MTLRTPLATILFASLVFAQAPVAGDWKGILDTGSDVLNLVLHLKVEGGKLSAAVENPDQNRTYVVEGAKIAGDQLELPIPSANGVYKGTVSGDEIKGKWEVGGNGVPLNFKRAGQASAMTPTAAKARLSEAERGYALAYLDKTRREFLASIAGVTPEQWAFKPSNGGWSIAECAEHITLSEDVIFGLLMNLLKQPAALLDAAARTREMDERIVAGVTDRSHKAQAPEVLKPSGKFPTLQSVERGFAERRDRVAGYVKTTDDDLRAHAMKNPTFGSMDAYQYILLLAAHSSRHTAQLNEVKTDPKFPK